MKRSTKAVLAALLVSFSAGALISCSNDKKPQQQDPQTQEQGDQQSQSTLEKDITVSAKQTLTLLVLDENGNPIQMGPIQKTEDIEYNVELKATKADHKFSLTLTPTDSTKQALDGLTGTYEYIDKVGYKFIVDGSGDVIVTRFDKVSKTQYFEYLLPLGYYGSDNISISWKDEKFEISDEKVFLSNVVFGGAFTSREGFVVHNPGKTEKGIGFGLKMYANGEFLFSSNHVTELNQTGTYTFDKTSKTFTLKLKDCDGTEKTYTSTFKNGVMYFDFTFNFVNANNETIVMTPKLEFNTNYYGGYGLTNVLNAMGSEFAVHVTFKDDNTVFIDGAPTEPTKSALAGMALYTMFDRKGTWTYDEINKVYTIKYTDYNQQGQPSEISFTIKYDETTKTYKTEGFKLGAAKGELEGTNLGKEFTLAK